MHKRYGMTQITRPENRRARLKAARKSLEDCANPFKALLRPPYVRIYKIALQGTFDIEFREATEMLYGLL
jgi:hypothetical protein